MENYEEKEESSEDFESEWKRYIDSKGGGAVTINVKDIARHFAHWQHGKDFDDLLQSEMEFPKEFYDRGRADAMNEMREALQTEYEKGRFDMREEMMKDAVEGTVKYRIGSAEIPQCDRRYQVLSDQTPIANAKLGDKVKIIICKTEQQ